MRILAVSHPCVTDVNQQFYAELEKLGHDVVLVVPRNLTTEYSNKPTKVVRWPDFAGDIVQIPVGLGRHIQLYYYQRSIREILLRHQPEVLYVEEEPYSVSAFQTFMASRGLPLVRIIYSAQNIYKRYPVPFNIMERYVLKHAQGAAVTSDEVTGVLSQKGYSGAIVPFPLGVDTCQFRPSSTAREQIRAQLNLDNSDFVVGYVGRFVREKGLELLLRLLPSMRTQGVKVILVGAGPMMAEVELAKKKYPDVLLVASDVPHRMIQDWMNSFDCLILPSITMPNWKEQFGRVIIEAMACGVPVIGSDSGQIPKLISDTGGGWVFPEGNDRGAMDLLKSIRANNESLMTKGQQGLQSVVERFSKQALAGIFSKYISSLQGL